MKEQIQSYLNEIYSEIRECYTDEINLNDVDFEKFTIFDFVNFHLVYQYILDDKSNKNDFFISIPEDEYRENFFASIFQSLVSIKLFQNYINYEKKKPEIEKGDLVYSKSRKRVFEVLNKSPMGLTLKYKFPNKSDGFGTFTISGHKFTKINPTLSNGRNTATNIDKYETFLKQTFGAKFPFITNFSCRTLVIADQIFFKESKHLPIRYTNKNGKIKNDLPFFNYMIECCNDFNTAQNFLINEDQQFDEIIIIGDAKYRNSFDFILQEKFRNKYKNIIVIGTDKPNSENQFLEWWWSNDEVKIANNEIPNEINKVKLNNTDLYSLFVGLKNEVETIQGESKVNLSFILKYTNFFLRMILVKTNLSKGIFQEYLDRLNKYFDSESFIEELNNFFYEKDIYNPDTIKDYTNRMFGFFSNISTELENENLKWNYIKLKATEAPTKPLFLIVEKKNYDAIFDQLKNERMNNIRLISDKRIDNSKLYLDKWLNDERQNSHKKTVILPYLNNLDLYSKIKSIKGVCEVLCYEGLDEISFDNVEQIYQNQEKTKLNHNDRTVFFKANFTHSLELKKRELDDIFFFDLDKENFKNNPYETIDLPKESTIYEIEFSDGTKEKFDSSKGVFLIENGEQIKITIGETYTNATIRYYQNNSRKDFRKILKIFDTENLLESFDEYSDSWKQTIKNLSEEYGGVENLYNVIFISHKINFNTFRLYFDEDSQTRFPRIKTLESIRDFCKNNSHTNELIVRPQFRKLKYTNILLCC